jgi:hypothetical protein
MFVGNYHKLEERHEQILLQNLYMVPILPTPGFSFLSENKCMSLYTCHFKHQHLFVTLELGNQYCIFAVNGRRNSERWIWTDASLQDHRMRMLRSNLQRYQEAGHSEGKRTEGTDTPERVA